MLQQVGKALEHEFGVLISFPSEEINQTALGELVAGIRFPQAEVPLQLGLADEDVTSLLSVEEVIAEVAVIGVGVGLYGFLLDLKLLNFDPLEVADIRGENKGVGKVLEEIAGVVESFGRGVLLLDIKSEVRRSTGNDVGHRTRVMSVGTCWRAG